MPRKKVVKNKSLTEAEVQELQEFTRLVNGKLFEAIQIKNNSALVPDGQKLAEQTEAVSKLLAGVKMQWVNQKLAEHGYVEGTKCNINLFTGEITLHEENGNPSS